MGSDVFANGRSVSCKSGVDKVIAAFPDVALSPPSPPAGPIPIPYPLFSKASDTTSGTKKVKINKKEAMTDKSQYKKSMGDEAATKSFGQGVITHCLGGKVKFISFSMDVKLEGKKAVRHLDMTTSNHMSPQANASVPWADVAKMKVAGHSCAKIIAEIHPYGDADCPEGSQSHHIVDNSNFTMPGARKTPLKDIPSVGGETGRQKRNLFPKGSKHPGRNYDENAAPCNCLKGSKSNSRTQHGKAHKKSKDMATAKASSDGKWKYSDAREAGKESIKKALKLEEWEAECIGLALDAYYKDKMKCNDGTETVAPTGKKSDANQFDNGKGTQCQAFELG